MIGKLKGVVDEILEAHIIIDVSGVGYLVHLPTAVLQKLVLGQFLVLWVEHVVTDVSQRLYGYCTPDEQFLACMLARVKGVSHRIASNLVGSLGCNTVIDAIQLQKPQNLRVTGVGNKLADRIVSELLGENLSSMKNFEASVQPRKGPDEALGALEALGYSKAAARSVIEDLLLNQEAKEEDVSGLVKKALQKLS